MTAPSPHKRISLTHLLPRFPAIRTLCGYHEAAVGHQRGQRCGHQQHWLSLVTSSLLCEYEDASEKYSPCVHVVT